MKSFIKRYCELKDWCSKCKGRPIDENGKLRSDDYSEPVCRYLFPDGYVNATPYHMDETQDGDKIIDQNNPCSIIDELSYLPHIIEYEMRRNDESNLKVPKDEKSIKEVLRELESVKEDQRLYSAILAAADYVLLLRKQYGDGNLDFLKICNQVGIEYSREEKLGSILDQPTYDLLVGNTKRQKKINKRKSDPNPLPETFDELLKIPQFIEALSHLQSVPAWDKETNSFKPSTQQNVIGAAGRFIKLRCKNQGYKRKVKYDHILGAQWGRTSKDKEFDSRSLNLKGGRYSEDMIILKELINAEKAAKEKK